MRVQMDTKVRVVALSNLIAMCARLSGVCNRFSVVSTSQHSVRVEYSNPDGYGNGHPAYVTYPAFRDTELDRNGLFVILHPLRVTGGHKDDYDVGQFFMALTDHPPLFRTSADSNEWLTRQEADARRGTMTMKALTCPRCQSENVVVQRGGFLEVGEYNGKGYELETNIGGYLCEACNQGFYLGDTIGEGDDE